MPSFVTNADALRDAGVELIVGIAVNDAFVMQAFGKETGAAQAKIAMIGDPDAELSTSLGLVLDASAGGLGLRCKRFALIAEAGVVKYLAVDTKGIELTTGNAILEVLKRMPAVAKRKKTALTPASASL